MVFAPVKGAHPNRRHNNPKKTYVRNSFVDSWWLDFAHSVFTGDVMTNNEADENERVFVEKAKAWHLELLEEKNQQAAKMPAYPRD